MEPAPVSTRNVCVYVSTNTVERRLVVQALYQWAKAGWIEHHCSPGGHCRWDVDGYLRRKRVLIQPDRTVLHRGILMLGMR